MREKWFVPSSYLYWAVMNAFCTVLLRSSVCSDFGAHQHSDLITSHWKDTRQNEGKLIISHV